MTAPLTHATLRGLALLRGEHDTRRYDPWVPACGAERGAAAVAANYLHDTIPTCPACAVLRDATLEGREVTP